MKFLQFKAENGETITFDAYEKEEEYQREDGYLAYWVTICPRCKQAFKHLLGYRIDDFGSGACSVLGCDNEGEFYVDFADYDVEEIE